MTEERISWRADGAVAVLTINHPSKRNAMDLAMWRGLADAAAEIVAAPNVRAMVVTGAGDAFVSGANIDEFDAARADAAAAAAYDATVAGALDALARAPKPVIAAIEGFCVGGGVSIAAAADLRVASSAARFAIPAARLGLAYPRSDLERLVDVIGAPAALDMLLTARRFDAEAMARFGFLAEIAPEGAALAAALRLAETIAANAPLSLATAKRMIAALRDGADAAERAALDAMIAACSESEDYREGRRAFAEKRAPFFKGA